MKESKYAYRFPPCPACDVEGTESWLKDMAARGLILSRDGFFLGAGIFEKSEPKKLRYRLEAAKRKSSLMSDYDETPDADALELSGQSGWEYVAMRGQFFIYRTDRDDAIELNTDPRVQAMSLNMVRRRELGNFIYWILWLCVIVPLTWRISPVLLICQFGLAKSLLTLAVIAFSFGAAARRLWLLRRLRRRLKGGEAPEHEKNWRKSAARYFALRVIGAGLTIIWAIVMLTGFLNSASDENKIRLGDYSGELPFATMEDLAPGGEYKREEMYFYGSNTVEVSSNLLAPFSAKYSEIAEITLYSGEKVSGILNISYYETVSPILARGAARALYRGVRDGEPMEIDIEGVEYCAAVMANDTMFPFVVVQDGCRVIRANFTQTSEFELPLEYWAGIIAGSIAGE